MSADRWGDDQLFEEAAQLTRAQIALRDNEAPPPPNAGAARARRIEAMQHEIAVCADFIADCDRYAESMRQPMTTPCLTPLIPKLMRRHLDDLRAQAVATGRRLRDELTILRGAS